MFILKVYAIFVHLILMTHILVGDSGPVFCLLLRVSSNYVQPITDQITEVPALWLAEHSTLVMIYC